MEAYGAAPRRSLRWRGVDLTRLEVIPQVLIYNCVAGKGPGLTAERGREFTAAYRLGIRQHLAALAERSSNVRVRTLDTHHMLILSMPDELADEIRRFVESHT